jgi:hypothetical protein
MQSVGISRLQRKSVGVNEMRLLDEEIKVQQPF